MTLKDLLKKKDKPRDDRAQEASPATSPDVPEFKFIRTTTNTQETISLPAFPGDPPPVPQVPEEHKRRSRFRRHSHAAETILSGGENSKAKSDRRLSDRLHLGNRSRGASTSSVNVPANLPVVTVDVARNEDDEAQWEQRATELVKGNAISRTPSPGPNVKQERERRSGGRARSVSVGDAGGDENIQEAIRLHEAGQLQESTSMFGRLADPKGQNNALSQVLYGLALRHGWGCEPNQAKAVEYLSYAASNSADVERLALQAGMKKGGAAKGELVLAIFELANCFRNGWGVKRDSVAAKQYYETAANLGDTDAMNEAAWCYLEGFGCKKDKYKAAQFLRLAEEKGNKTLGNSWIWKEKYNPKP